MKVKHKDIETKVNAPLTSLTITLTMEKFVEYLKAQASNLFFLCPAGVISKMRTRPQKDKLLYLPKKSQVMNAINLSATFNEIPTMFSAEG